MKNIFSVIAIVYMVRLLVLTSRVKDKDVEVVKGAEPPVRDSTSLKTPVDSSQIFKTSHSFALCIVLMAGSFAVGIFIWKMVGSAAGLVYLSYWLPCCAAILFGLGTAYRPGLLPEDSILVSSVLKLSDKSLFEYSGIMLYGAFAVNIYVGPCSQPAIYYFGVFTAIPAALMYLWRVVKLYREGVRDFWRLPGFVVILFLFLLLLAFTILYFTQTDPTRLFKNACVAYQ